MVLFYDFWHELATPTDASAASAADDDGDNVVDLPREYKQTKTERVGMGGTKLCSFVKHSLSPTVLAALNLFAFTFVFVFVFVFAF